MKTKQFHSNIFFCTRGLNEILGLQEVLGKKTNRENYCECISASGKVLCMRSNEFIKRVSCFSN